MYRKIIPTAVLLALIATFFTASFASAADKLGFINAQMVLIAYPKYEAVQKQLDEFTAKKNQEAREATEKETDQAKRMEIIQKARDECGVEEMRVMNPIMEQIDGVIRKVAEAKGVTIVLNRMMVYFGGVDITDDVVKGVKELK